MRIALRSLGWLFIAAGLLVALYLVYSLYWTGLETSQAQDRLMQEFEASVGEPVAGATPEEFELEVADLDPLTATSESPEGSDQDDDPTVTTELATPASADLGAAVGVMTFHRPGTSAPVVIDEPLVVVEGVTVDVLKDGPGRYPGTAQPGQHGNLAIAGHRTTYGAPFWDLDQLQEGDEIHVTDRNGTRWVYEYEGSRIVAPDDVSVLGDDPLGLGTPMLTLTTCHPRWSQTERLIVFASLSDEQLPLARAA